MRTLKVALTILGCTVATPGSGAIMTFTDRATWEAAASMVGVIQIEDFESVETGSLTPGVVHNLGLIGFTYVDGLFAVGGGDVPAIRVTDINGNRAFAGSPFRPDYIGFPRPDCDGPCAPRDHNFLFAGLVNGFGADFFGSPTNGADLIIDVAGESVSLLAEIGDVSGSFFGILSTIPFDSVVMRAGDGLAVNEVFEMDNFSLVAVPGPAAIWLMAGAVAVLGCARRQR